MRHEAFNCLTQYLILQAECVNARRTPAHVGYSALRGLNGHNVPIADCRGVKQIAVMRSLVTDNSVLGVVTYCQFYLLRKKKMRPANFLTMNTPDDLQAFSKELFDLRALRGKEAEEVVRATCTNGPASMVYGISALYAAWQTFVTLPPDGCVRGDSIHLTNFFVANNLSWLCNTAVAIRILAFQGLEPQARVLTRSFVEAIYQTLVLFHDKDSYAIYRKGVTNEESKKVYYELFSKKNRLQKKIQILEDELGHTPEEDRANQLMQRIGILEHYSQATHSSYCHVLKSGYQRDKDNNLQTIILGRVTKETENTLLNCSHVICYFSVHFDHIVRNVWKIQNISDNLHYDMFFKSATLAAIFLTHKVDSCASDED